MKFFDIYLNWVIVFLCFVSSILLCVSLYSISYLKTHVKYLDDVKNECIIQGGQYSVMDHSLDDDGSDYKATCKIPAKVLWSIKI